MSTAPRLTIDLNALVENWQAMADHSGKARASAVVKADGYGLGIKPVVEALYEAGCRTFFTAMIEEATTAREVAKDARILLLNGVFSDTIDAVKQISAIPVLSSLEQVRLWVEEGNHNPSALHVDTGMNRLGLSIGEAEGLARKLDVLAQINSKIIMSHLACADEPDDPANGVQLAKFQEITSLYSNLEKSFANSAGIMLGEDYHFGLTRPGISIYGAEAINNVPNPMKVVVTAEARILQIRNGLKGETVGYGGAHKLERDTKIAICSGGYADGLHRSLSGSGVPLRQANTSGGFGAIFGELVPVLGRVSMDLTAFDVTDLPERILNNAKWIELFGKNISIDDAARSCGTIGYELLTSLGNRYQREFIKD